MARIKRGSPPLFELLDGNRLRRSDVATHPNLRVIPAEPQGEEALPASGTKPHSVAVESSPEKSGDRAVFQLLGDRLHLSLTPLTAALGVFAVTLVVLGAIYLGQQRGEKAALRAVSQ